MADKKMGRPTDDPKTNVFQIRISDSDLQMLEICCKETKLSRAEVIRLGIRKVYDGLKIK